MGGRGVEGGVGEGGRLERWRGEEGRDRLGRGGWLVGGGRKVYKGREEGGGRDGLGEIGWLGGWCGGLVGGARGEEKTVAGERGDDFPRGYNIVVGGRGVGEGWGGGRAG